jgi:toxin-antitoxin system PIN domain toxin
VIVVDLNLLLYAVNESAVPHKVARRWWERALSQGTQVGIAWSVILGFLRLTTNPRVMPRPLSVAHAVEIIDEWLAHPSVEIIEPTERHWEILRDLLSELGAAGNLTSDAHLAALAIERGAVLCSADNDFSRFPRLRWSNPLKAAR